MHGFVTVMITSPMSKGSVETGNARERKQCELEHQITNIEKSP